MSSYTVITHPGSDLPKMYQGLVYSKWLRSLRYGNDDFRMIDADHYYAAYHAYLGVLLNKPNCQLHFAVLTDDHDVVLGFSVSRGELLDYVHVHLDYRCLGIATKLIPTEAVAFTHITKMGKSYWQKKRPDLLFKPFM